MLPVAESTIWAVLSWLVLGFVAGYVVHFIDKRNVTGGLFPTLITGIIGAVVGGFLSEALFGFGITGLNIASLIIAVIGGLIFSYLERAFIAPRTENRNYAKEPQSADKLEGMVFNIGNSGTRQLVNPIQVQKFLKNVNYPASKDDLINEAKKEGADENVISTLERLPERQYDGPISISEEIGKLE